MAHMYCPSLVHSKDSLSIHFSFFHFSYCLRQWIIRIFSNVSAPVHIKLYVMHCNDTVKHAALCCVEKWHFTETKLEWCQYHFNILLLSSFCGGVIDYLIITYHSPYRYARGHWMDRIYHICEVILARGSNLSTHWRIGSKNTCTTRLLCNFLKGTRLFCVL